jgi:hypothetical protein
MCKLQRGVRRIEGGVDGKIIEMRLIENNHNFNVFDSALISHFISIKLL